MKKFALALALFAFVGASVSAANFGDDKDKKACSGEKKACCKSKSAKACSDKKEAKAEETKASTAEVKKEETKK